jgi:hypothetical protein
VNRATTARITRYLLLQKIKDLWLAVLLFPIFFAALVLATVDYPIARQMRDCRYIRWTIDQQWTLGVARYGEVVPLVFCDLPDGRTIGALATGNWAPPRPGEIIRVEEQTMVWGGVRYRIP